MDHLNYIDIFDKGTSYFIADTVFSGTNKTSIHKHNFYEFFLLRQGQLKHFHNNEEYVMAQGEICFVHPNDEHYFQAIDDKEPAIITNLAFAPQEYELALQYLQCPDVALLTEHNRKTILGNSTFSSLSAAFESIYKYNGTVGGNELLFIYRALLTQAIVLLLKKPLQSNNAIPVWLSKACVQMEKPTNFRKGITKFVSLSGKTQEHLNRSMKKHLNTTPSEFVNNLRLLEAAKQLRNSTNPISDIVFGTGFDNPSYFNRLFKAKYGQSPGKYRLLNMSIVNPGPGISKD